MPTTIPATTHGSLTLLQNANVKITEVKNLTTGQVIEKTVIDFEKLSSQSRFAPEIIVPDVDAAPADFPSSTDDIQVLWTSEEGGNKTTVFRAVAGSATFDATARVIKISSLQDVSKFRISFRGELAIGPIDNVTKKVDRTKASLLSVKFGNINKYNERILDFNNKEDDAPGGTKIKVPTLIEWIKGSQGVGEVDMPLEDGEKGKLDDLEVLFNDLYINLDRKTFNIDIKTTGSLSIADGMEISNLGLVLTNEAPVTAAILPEKAE